MEQPRRWVETIGLDATIGVDVEDVARWHDPDERLFTTAERRHCEAHGDPAQAFAGRWAAKESVVKAVLPHCAVTPRDVEIVAAPDGAPQARIRLPEHLAGALAVSVSISHTHHTAMACAVATLDRAALARSTPDDTGLEEQL